MAVDKVQTAPRLRRKPKFPKGCVIRNLRRHLGRRGRGYAIYGDLYSPDGEILISATLEYINERLLKCGVEHD